MEIGALIVGEKAPFNISQEIAFTMQGGAPILVINWHNITPSELKSLKGTDHKFAFLYRDGIMFLLAKFGTIEWMDVPYSVHLDRGEVNLDLDIPDGQGLALQLIVINADNNKILALKLIGLKTNFSRKFIDMIIAQAKEPFDALKYNQKLIFWRDKYTTKQMVDYADERE